MKWSAAQKMRRRSLLSLVLVLCWAATAQTASFDCAKAALPAEKFVCANPFISGLDDKLDAVYRSVLAKASDEQKQQVMAQQKHWLKHTRNVCTREVCFKHAYWTRQAELATFFEPKSPLYAKESDKAVAIQKVLAEAPLYESSLSDPPMCSSQWLSEFSDECSNPLSERCYKMIDAVRKALNEQLKCVTSKLSDPESFVQAHRAWKQYNDLECKALVPQCPYGQSGSCNMPSSICETYLNCKQIDHLYDVEHNRINSYNER